MSARVMRAEDVGTIEVEFVNAIAFGTNGKGIHTCDDAYCTKRKEIATAPFSVVRLDRAVAKVRFGRKRRMTNWTFIPKRPVKKLSGSCWRRLVQNSWILFGDSIRR